MLGVDDFSQLLAIDDLLIDVHLDFVIKIVELLHVGANNLGNRRAPVQSNSLVRWRG